MVETLLMNSTAIRCFGRLDTHGLVAVGSHSMDTTAGFRFFIRGRAGTSFSLVSKTGITQRCPFSMPLYGLASLPLIRKLNNECTLDRHLWYAHDSGAGATLTF